MDEPHAISAMRALIEQMSESLDKDAMVRVLDWGVSYIDDTYADEDGE